MTELEKWDAVYQDFFTIRDMLSDLPKGIALCEYSDGAFYPLCSSEVDHVVYKYLGIDYKKLDEELRALLKKLQEKPI